MQLLAKQQRSNTITTTHSLPFCYIPFHCKWKAGNEISIKIIWMLNVVYDENVFVCKKTKQEQKVRTKNGLSKICIVYQTYKQRNGIC